MPEDVYLTEANLFGEWLYRVMVNGVKRDEFFTKTRLTWSEQTDVAAGYREGLDNRPGTC